LCTFACGCPKTKAFVDIHHFLKKIRIASPQSCIVLNASMVASPRRLMEPQRIICGSCFLLLPYISCVLAMGPRSTCNEGTQHYAEVKRPHNKQAASSTASLNLVPPLPFFYISCIYLASFLRTLPWESASPVPSGLQQISSHSNHPGERALDACVAQSFQNEREGAVCLNLASS